MNEYRAGVRIDPPTEEEYRRVLLVLERAGFKLAHRSPWRDPKSALVLKNDRFFPVHYLDPDRLRDTLAAMGAPTYPSSDPDLAAKLLLHIL